MDVRRFLAFDLLLEVIGQGLLVEFPHQSEALEVLVLGGTILIDAVVHNTGDHSNLVGVILRPAHLCRK